MLVTTHNVSLRIREDLGPSLLLHASPGVLPMHNTRQKGNYSCLTLEMGTVLVAESTEHDNRLRDLVGGDGGWGCSPDALPLSWCLLHDVLGHRHLVIGLDVVHLAVSE